MSSTVPSALSSLTYTDSETEIDREEDSSSNVPIIERPSATNSPRRDSKYLVSVNSVVDAENRFLQPHCTSFPTITLFFDGQTFSWVMKHMRRSRDFRSQFLRIYLLPLIGGTLTDRSKLTVLVYLKPPLKPVLDQVGNQLVNSYVLVKCEMETALSWLSTLGGAFSALGDLSHSYAVEAGRVSMSQLKIATKLDDPLIASRCRLYAAISLLQRGYLLMARRIVKDEYKYAMSLPETQDPKLRRMCLGVWAKLQYAWKLNKHNYVIQFNEKNYL